MKTLLLLSALVVPTPLFAAPATPSQSQTAPPKPLANPKKSAAPSTKTASTKAAPAKTTVPTAKTPAKTVAAPEAVKVAAKALPKAVLAASTGTTLEKLPNGVQFITRPDHLAPLAAISIVIRAGAAEENVANAGWRRFLVGAMLRSAPRSFDAKAGVTLVDFPSGEGLPRAAEKLGGTVGATVGDDFIEIYAVGPSQNAPQLLELALALWQHPRLSDEDLKAARQASQNQVDADNLDTASKTQAALRSQLFRDARGELSAYGLPDYGTDESLAALSDEKVRALFSSKVARARATVAVTGDFDAPALRQKLLALPARGGAEPATPFFATPKSVAALVVREQPIPTAWVFISYPLAGDTKNEAPALRVLAAALGDSGAARLPARLLKNQPLGAQPVAASVAAQFIPRRYAGELVVFAQTGPQNVERVKNALLDEIRKLRDAPLPQSELQSAKTYARGSWSLERQNGRDRAFQTALSPALGGPLDSTFPARLESVSSAQVQAAAKKYLKSYAVALVMPGE